MSTEDNGGPAFPAEIGPTPSGGFQSGPDRMHCPGMTLRDYFAAQSIGAIATLVAHGLHTLQQIDMDSPEASIARDAYRVADAMLKERAK